MSSKAKRPTGPVPGVKRPCSPATRRANRVRPWIHGGSAKTVTLSEATGAQLAKIHPDAPDLVQRYTKIMAGEIGEREALAVKSFVTQEIISRRMADEIVARGEVVQEAIIGPDGDPIGVKLKAHPLLDPYITIQENLGYTAEQQELTPHSKKDGAANAALEAAASREQRILDALSSVAQRRLAKDPALIEATTVTR